MGANGSQCVGLSPCHLCMPVV